MAQSIEPNIADLANGWLKSYNLPYKLEQEEVNEEIGNALSDYHTKSGGAGVNRPDAKILLQDKNLNFYPVLIEYKGYKDKLVKLNKDGQVENRTSKNAPDFKNIKSFAVNGAVHYANALLHHTSYTDIIAIGMTGYKDETGKIHHEIGVYYVSKSNLGAGQKIGEFTDFSFLAPKNFDAFIGTVKKLQLSQEELDKLKEQREREIDQSLVKLNNDIYQNEKGLGENDRVYLVAASIIATLGIPGKVAPLEKSDLKSSTEQGYRDGDLMINKIESFLSHKELPEEKRNLTVRTLSNTLLMENINKVENGESQLKRVFAKIVDDLGIYYKIGLTTDFTGKLFNEMYGWLGFSQDKLNDVVLTPSYIASLLVKLARVNKDSYVWDFATGSAGLLVAAMNEMLIDAKNNIQSPDDLTQKEIKIKTEQLLGLELLSSVYMLAILNMILMGDGSSNILNTDSIKDFDGKRGFGKTDTKFPADAFILNPPYSAPGKGMNFVEKALNMMNKGYAAIIIQNSSGSGKAVDYNKRILSKHTLLASIKMPVDIFIGKSSVQTQIYVFKVNEKHHRDEVVKFIDFTNDGYTRANRKKASTNLKDTDQAKERYQEVADLVRFGKSKLTIFTEKEYYEGHIDPNSGADWNQSAPIDTKPTIQDFKKTVSDYLSWEISTLLKQNTVEEEFGKQQPLENHFSEISLSDYHLTEQEKEALESFENGKIKLESFTYKTIFNIIKQGRRLKKYDQIPGSIPFIMAGITNTGVVNYISNPVASFPKNSITVDIFGNTFYRNYDYGAGDDTGVYWNDKINYSKEIMVFFASAMGKSVSGKFDYGKKLRSSKSFNFKMKLPVKDNKPDYETMEIIISAIHKLVIKDVVLYVARKKNELNKLIGNANA